MVERKKTAKKADAQRRRRVSSDTADWEGIDCELLRRLIGAVTKNEGALRFGYSRDGGAYSLGIYGDLKPFTEFCPGNADVEQWLRDIVEDYS